MFLLANCLVEYVFILMMLGYRNLTCHVFILFVSLSFCLAGIQLGLCLKGGIYGKPKGGVYKIELLKIARGGEEVNYMYTLQHSQNPVKAGRKRKLQ